MAKREVHVQGVCDAPADAIWTVVRDFCGAWHPAVVTIVAEDGAQTRRFTVHGENTVYREMLTYFSDSDRSYSYKHLEGIREVESYQATLTVSQLDAATCRIDWRATISAEEPRASEIAEGTSFVFQMGIDALQATSSRHVTLPGVPAIALTVSGKPSETLCLFLHGIGGRRQNWARQLPVAAQSMQAAAMDLRGYGDSQLGPAPSTVDDYCADILRAMHLLGAKRVVLCGLSYGSWIAASFAMRHSDKLAGFVLSGGCTGMSEASDDERERFRASREVPLNEGKIPKDFAPAVVNVIASPHASDAVRNELFDSMAAIPPATYRDALRCFTNPAERLDFSGWNMPVLFVTGEHDKLATSDEIRGVSHRVHAQAQHPHVRFEILDGAGHVCNVEAPLAYNRLLAGFLRGLSA